MNAWPDRPLRIGLTGPIGCGKSTVAGWLAEHPDVLIIDADRVAREVLEPGSAELDAVYRRFGEDLRRGDGSLDRAGLARLVFTDPPALADLEAIVHPAVRPRIEAALFAAEDAGAAIIVVEAIKLVEGGLAELCDEVWLVTCDPAVQVTRLVGRGADPVDVEARIETQGDLTERLRPRATRVLDTSGTREGTRAVVEDTLRAALADRPGPSGLSPRA